MHIKELKNCTYLICGAGITGLAIANELVNRGADDILIIEKEAYSGAHASGRNSGVLHAGIYYTPDSLKAKFCVEGNRLMKSFCRLHNLVLLETGKTIVMKIPSELDRLMELKKRADSCGAYTQIIESKDLTDLEPYAYTADKALYSPETAVIDPKQILQKLVEVLLQSGKVRISYSTSFLHVKDTHTIYTSRGSIAFKKFINAAGAFADKVAHSFGLAKEYKILPFKGTYKKLKKERDFLVQGNIYPVPDLRNPFLGVHFTRNADGNVYVGPTAIPALGRENYSFFAKLGPESVSILYRDAILLLLNDSFRYSAIAEIKKYFSQHFYESAKTLVPSLRIDDLEESQKVGIRPQLVNWPQRKLELDFLLLKDAESLHVLNAISPAFTTSMAFARYAASLLES